MSAKKLTPPAGLDAALAEMDAYAKTLDPESEAYWNYHRRRFSWISMLLNELVAEKRYHGKEPTRLLDIGNSYQTLLFEKLFPSMQIDTMGFLVDRYKPRGKTDHYPYDLNESYREETWPQPKGEKYDFIALMEVIEHLYTAPQLVLKMLSSLLKPDGVLIVQTPNAVALKKRFRLLIGRVPYELIREDRMNPGHFRELSREELCHVAHHGGFYVKGVFMRNYFYDGGWFDRACDRVSNYLPGDFRSGMTITFIPQRG